MYIQRYGNFQQICICKYAFERHALFKMNGCFKKLLRHPEIIHVKQSKDVQYFVVFIIIIKVRLFI